MFLNFLPVTFQMHVPFLVLTAVQNNTSTYFNGSKTGYCLLLISLILQNDISIQRKMKVHLTLNRNASVTLMIKYWIKSSLFEIQQLFKLLIKLKVERFGACPDNTFSPCPYLLCDQYQELSQDHALSVHYHLLITLTADARHLIFEPGYPSPHYICVELLIQEAIYC